MTISNRHYAAFFFCCTIAASVIQMFNGFIRRVIILIRCTVVNVCQFDLRCRMNKKSIPSYMILCIGA